jgi:hypothetical protein
MTEPVLGLARLVTSHYLLNCSVARHARPELWAYETRAPLN